MFKFKFEMTIIKILVNLLRAIPEKLRYKLIEGIAVLTYKTLKSRREITHKNLKIAFPDISADELERISIASYKNVLKGFVMTFWLKDFKSPEKASFVNEEVIDEALAQNKGLIIISMHMGCLDASVRTTEKVKINSVARKQKNPLMSQYLQDIRESVGYHVVYRGDKSMRTIVKALRNKESVYLVSDHYDMKGLETDFFGRKTKVSPGAVSLALRYGAPVIFLYNEINEDNTVSLHFEKGFEVEKTGDKEKDMEVNIDKMVSRFEEIMTKYPEQWMWFHKRWRK